MIASLRGRLVHKDTQGAVVECAGVGYGVAMSLASLAQLGDVGREVHVHVHTHVSQDALRLFGFADPDERTMFELLIATAGVGPRLALAILSTLTPNELADAVAGGDKTSLTRIPGVGPKKAERLLVELKDRVAGRPVTGIALRGGGLRDDLLSALMNLGFAQPVAERAAKHAIDSFPEQMDLTTLVREALRATTTRH
jgi:Holliday junction DNA helicase RuvA